MSWYDRDRQLGRSPCECCNSAALVSTAYAVCSPIVCSPVTALQHGVLDLVLGPPHSERVFLPVKPSVSARDLQEEEKRNQCAYLHDTFLPIVGLTFFVLEIMTISVVDMLANE